MVRRSTRFQAAMAEPKQLSSPSVTPAPASKRASRRSHSKASPDLKEEDVKQEPSTPAPSNKSRKRAKPADTPTHDLPHNLGYMPTPTSKPPAKRSRATNAAPKVKETSPHKKAAATTTKRSPRKAPQPSAEELEKIATNAGLLSPSPETNDGKEKKKKKKSINYKLTPGASPYPGYAHPTAEECHEVVRLLSKVHGEVTVPKEIKAPSLTTAGCGEVPSVLDALIRTRLSAATTGTNSSRAFQGLVKTFGTLDSGRGRGSVDWGAVRKASQPEIFEAIKCGGLAGSKSKDIKEILTLVWEENVARAEALKSSSSSSVVAGADRESGEEKRAELDLVDRGQPSLDHLHLLSNEEAFDKLVSYPGIGPKTASCVLLFCLRRPSFAVDTHVFRLCRYLGWVPGDAEAKAKGWPKVERNTTYSHCEVTVPDELKYALHQLLIKHGKTCGRCRAATGIGSEGWKRGCPIEHLVKRHGAKKGEGIAPPEGESEEEEEEEEEEEGGMSGVGSDSDEGYQSDSQED